MINRDAFFMLMFMERMHGLHPNAGIQRKDHETLNLHLRSLIGKCFCHTGSNSL